MRRNFIHQLINYKYFFFSFMTLGLVEQRTDRRSAEVITKKARLNFVR